MVAGRVLIGVGNEYRRDDGVGPALVAQVAGSVASDVVVSVVDGEPVALLDAWAGAELAVVVDAARCEPSTPGRIHRRGADEPIAARSASTHALGVAEALELAAALGRAPTRLVIYTVEAADLGHGAGLSPLVAAAVPALARAVLADLGQDQRPGRAGP